jgi:hypothetical protein
MAGAQFTAFPHVLELAKSRALLFPQQGCQGLRLPRWHGFAPVQMSGNRPLQVHKVGGVVRFPAHGSTVLRGLIWSPILLRHPPPLSPSL